MQNYIKAEIWFLFHFFPFFRLGCALVPVVDTSLATSDLLLRVRPLEDDDGA